jgi:cytochrome c oxidase cbb3-type subunit III
MRLFPGVAICIGAACAIATLSCQREQRQARPAPAESVVFGSAARESDIQPGGAQTQPQATNPYNANAYAISEGQRLYDWYNCSGCHFHGGGGIGPALMDDVWVYGGEPANIFDTIVKGRPNGMPAWGGRIPQYQIWQLVAYVRSMSGQQPKSATPARTDIIELYPKSLQNKVPGQTQ